MEIFLNSSKSGAVFFSIGSNLRSDHMSIEKQKYFINAFAELNEYNFLWKFESEIPASDLPKNVMIRKWVPQSDILAHPKLEAFISHGGMSFVYL